MNKERVWGTEEGDKEHQREIVKTYPKRVGKNGGCVNMAVGCHRWVIEVAENYRSDMVPARKGGRW